MSRPLPVALACLLAASVPFAAGDGKQDAEPAWKTLIPPTEFAPVVAEAVRAVEKDLAVADKDPQARVRARGTALMVAAYAQGSIKGDGADARQRAALRDAALKLAGTINEKRLADAADQFVHGLMVEVVPVEKGDDGARI